MRFVPTKAFDQFGKGPVLECGPCGGECCGPCYDYCACAHCWRGWTGIPFRTRLKWRIQYLLGRHG